MYTLEQKVNLVMACLEGSGDFESLDPSIREALELGCRITQETPPELTWRQRFIDSEKHISELLDEIGCPDTNTSRPALIACIKRYMNYPQYKCLPYQTLVADTFPGMNNKEIELMRHTMGYCMRAICADCPEGALRDRILASNPRTRSNFSSKEIIAICAEEVQYRMRRA